VFVIETISSGVGDSCGELEPDGDVGDAGRSGAGDKGCGANDGREPKSSFSASLSVPETESGGMFGAAAAALRMCSFV
jgi:hypothetical protein